jgi:hypothetical protein
MKAREEEKKINTISYFNKLQFKQNHLANQRKEKNQS